MASQKPPRIVESTQDKPDAKATISPAYPQNKAHEVEEPIPVTTAVDEPPSRSWYGGGTWPRIQKSTPSIQVAKESILAGKPKSAHMAADLARFEVRKPEAQSVKADAPRPPSMDPGKSKETLELMPGELSDTDIATRVRVDAVDDGVTTNGVKPSIEPPSEIVNGEQGCQAHSKLESEEAIETQRESGWLEWLRITKAQHDSNKGQEPNHLVAESQHVEEGSGHASVDLKQPQYSLASEPVDEPLRLDASAAQKPAKPTTLWSGIWPYSATSTVSQLPKTIDQPDVEADSTTSTVPQPPKTIDQPDVKADSTVDKAVELGSTSVRNGSSWAFWSKQTSKTSETATESEDLGELAVTGEPSQDHPVPAHSNKLNSNKREPTKQFKRDRVSSSEAQNQMLPQADISTGPVAASSVSQKPNSNLLLPSFTNTYHLAENPSIVQQISQHISRLLLHGRQYPANSRQSPATHVFLAKDPPKIKKAIAIGIHGLFPAALLSRVIGQPTGTSIRFANYGAAAIGRWADKHGFPCEIEKVALEGEGKISERVDHLWKLLLNWIEHVRQADFILIACHSQGVPVAMMLTAKLIALGVVTSARIGVCAMAGVSLGPFPDYKSRFFSGSAAELFEFADPDSEVSRKYEESLRVALKYGVRVTYVGSIDDQLVSLDSAVFSPMDHPYIYRAVFVDGRVHAPDFIAHLVGFALKLRNLGVSDHQLIRALSNPLAGSLYSGEGHSRLYDEEGIYDLAVQFALETTSVHGDVPLKVRRHEPPANSNPSQLPWSMRGLLEEDVVKTELDQESKELLLLFDEWKPTSKVLKDVKYRLEVIKSKL